MHDQQPEIEFKIEKKIRFRNLLPTLQNFIDGRKK